MSKVDTVAKLVSGLDQQLRAAEKEATQINAREGLLGKPITDYSQIKQLSDMFDPFQQFWSAAGSWKVVAFVSTCRDIMNVAKPTCRFLCA